MKQMINKIIITIFSVLIIGLVVMFGLKYNVDQKNLALTAQNNQTTAANVEKANEAEAATSAANAADVKAANSAKLIADAKIKAAALLAVATKKANDASNASNKVVINNNVSAIATSTSNATNNTTLNVPAVFNNVPENYKLLKDSVYNFTVEYPCFLTDVTTYQNNQGYAITSDDGTTSLSSYVSSCSDILSTLYTTDMQYYNATKITATSYGNDDDWFLISWLDGENTVYEKVEIDSANKLAYTSVFSCPSAYVDSYQPYIDRFSFGFLNN